MLADDVAERVDVALGDAHAPQHLAHRGRVGRGVDRRRLAKSPEVDERRHGGVESAAR